MKAQLIKTLAAALLATTAQAQIAQQPIALSSSSKQKHLVTSDALQADINEDALQKRAKALYKIAQEGVEDYGHPTRVIGSQGMSSTSSMLFVALITQQVTPPHLITLQASWLH